MSYELAFKATALKEWRKLSEPIRNQFKARLVERLAQPHIASARLSTLPNCYKIKLTAVGYRLVYQVIEREITVVVVAVGKRDRLRVYRDAAQRLRDEQSSSQPGEPTTRLTPRPDPRRSPRSTGRTAAPA